MLTGLAAAHRVARMTALILIVEYICLSIHCINLAYAVYSESGLLVNFLSLQAENKSNYF